MKDRFSLIKQKKNINKSEGILILNKYNDNNPIALVKKDESVDFGFHNEVGLDILKNYDNNKRT